MKRKRRRWLSDAEANALRAAAVAAFRRVHIETAMMTEAETDRFFSDTLAQQEREREAIKQVTGFPLVGRIGNKEPK